MGQMTLESQQEVEKYRRHMGEASFTTQRPLPCGLAPYRACCQEPTNDGPSRQNVRTQHFIRRVDYPTDVANEVTAQRLTVWG